LIFSFKTLIFLKFCKLTLKLFIIKNSTALEEVARLIFFHDFTEHKTILEHVIEKLKDPHNFKDIMGVLRIIDIIAQVCKPVIYMRKEVIPTAIQKGFNQLLVLIEGLCSNYTEQSAEIINKIFDTVELAKKVFFIYNLSK